MGKTNYKKLAPQSKKAADTAQAKAIVKLQKQVRMLSHQEELKWKTLEANSTCSNVWNVYELMVNSQSAADTGHIGNKCTPKRLRIRCQLICGDTTNVVRIFVAQIKGSYANFSPANQLPQSSSTSNMCYIDVNPNVKDSFYKILHDRTYALNTANVVNREITIDVKPRHSIIYPEGGLTSSEDGGLIIAFVSDSLATPNPAFNFASTCYYVDA